MGCAIFEDEGYRIHCRKIELVMSLDDPERTLKDVRDCPDVGCMCDFRREKTLEMANNGGKPIAWKGWMCGPGINHCRYCMRIAEFICDYPIGKGKTCDIPVCAEHAKEIGDDLHLCEVHKILAESK